MQLIITDQVVKYCAGREMMRSDITLVLHREKLSAKPAGRAIIAQNRAACPVATRSTATASSPTNAFVIRAGWASCATNASGIRDACMALAHGPGTASVRRAGAVCSAIKISTTAPTIGRVETAVLVITPGKEAIHVCVRPSTRGQIARNPSTLALYDPASTVAHAFRMKAANSLVHALKVMRVHDVKHAV